MQPKTHKTVIQNQPVDGVDRFRWRCTCGHVGPWKSGASGSGGGSPARRASNGGLRHVAAMERGA